MRYEKEQRIKYMLICRLSAKDVLKNLDENLDLISILESTYYITEKPITKKVFQEWQMEILEKSIEMGFDRCEIIDGAIELARKNTDLTKKIVGCLKKLCQEDQTALKYLREKRCTEINNTINLNLAAEIDNNILGPLRNIEIDNKPLGCVRERCRYIKTGYRAPGLAAR